MKRTIVILSALWLCLSVGAIEKLIPESQINLLSPDGNQVLTYYQKVDDAGRYHSYYTVSYKNQPVILESELNLELDNHIWEMALAKNVPQPNHWCENLVFDKSETTSFDNTWKPVCGERSSIRDNYNGATVFLKKKDNSQYRLNIEFRAYNQGVAFRYILPEHPEAIFHKITAERTEFTLPEGTKAWFARWAQAPYALLPLKDWADSSERPLTLQLQGGVYACIAEAQCVDYSTLRFKLSETKSNTLVSDIYDMVDVVTPFETPWRVVMAANTPGALVDNNDIILNLNPENQIANTDWIKAGKIMRIMKQTTKDALETIDFAAKHKLEYVLFDWKWYGIATKFTSDATQVIPELDMPRIVKYAKDRGIGVWLYVNQHALQTQLDKILLVYKQWGIAGLKFGFVQYCSNRWSVWLHDAVKKCAENNLMVNIHDEYRPTGFSRTYPNLLTQEGIRGNEEFPEATHNTILPFTRGIAGAADYTVCYYDKRLKTTHGHQLALSVVFYSPLITLYWYDKPAFSHDEPELEFFDRLPATWDDSKLLSGKPGEHVIEARRHGDKWFLGVITNNDARKLILPLNFISPNKKYVAHIYNDGGDEIQTATKVKIEPVIVDSKSLIQLSLKASGGCAIRLVPATKDDLKNLPKFRTSVLY